MNKHENYCAANKTSFIIHSDVSCAQMFEFNLCTKNTKKTAQKQKKKPNLCYALITNC